MNNRLKIKSFITIIMLITLITISTIVMAATGGNYSVKMSLTSNSKLKAGDTVTVNVNVTSVNALDGIDAIAAAINYDENVFETLSTSSMVATNEWTPTYAASTKMLTLKKDTKVSKAETVLTIKLKVKDTINVDSTTIKLQEVVASNGIASNGGTGDIEVGEISVTINKDKESTGSTEQPKNNITDNTKPNTTVKRNTTDNTVTKKSTLPKAGLQQYGMIAIAVVAIVSIFSYVLYKKISKEVK